MMATERERSLEVAAISSIAWSLVQTWGARFSSILLFVALARVLTPTDYATASIATTVIAFILLVAEFGFADAIVQRQELRANDSTAPFVVALSLAVLFALLSVALSGHLEQWLGAPQLGSVIVGLAPLAPLSTFALFQEAHYRRGLKYKPLALRTLVANVGAGGTAIALAMNGFGVWSIVAQGYVAVIVSIAWLWLQPEWLPARPLSWPTFASMARYSVSIVSVRVLDFTASRTVELVIILRFGLVTYGLYAVSSRVYLLLLQLLQSALSDVALSLLSRVAHDRQRMADAYIRSLTMSSVLAAPAFILSAALLPEISVVFGDQWNGVADLALPLLFVGAVQAVQFLNGAYLNARGKPATVLAIAVLKYSIMIAGLFVLPGASAAGVVSIYAALQLVATPLSFFAIAKELEISVRRILLQVAPSVFACALSYFACVVVRSMGLGLVSLSSLFIVGATFAGSYLTVMLLVGRRQIVDTLTVFTSRIGPRRG